MERDPLVRRHERVHEPGARRREAVERDGERTPSAVSSSRIASTSSAKNSFWRRASTNAISVTAAMLPEGPVGPDSVRARLYRARVASDPARATPFWYLQGGDAVRAIACLGIVCFHVATGALFITGNLAGAGGTETWMTGYGESGEVILRTLSTGFYLFFVVSGFFVSAPFVSAFVEGRPMPRLLPYFRNRALRLLPAAWLLFAFVLVRHGSNGATLGELAAMFTFTDDHVDHPLSTLVGQTWTLRVDLSFYVLVPLAAALAVRLLGPRLGMAGRRRAVWVGRGRGRRDHLLRRRHIAVLDRHDPLARRCCSACSCRASRSPPRSRAAGRCAPPPRLPLLAAALSVAGVVLLVAFPRETLPLSGKLANVGIAAGMALGGVILLENFAGRTWRWMRAGPVRWVGRHTYGIYLWHLVLMAELSRLFTGATSRHDDVLHPAPARAGVVVRRRRDLLQARRAAGDAAPAPRRRRAATAPAEERRPPRPSPRLAACRRLPPRRARAHGAAPAPPRRPATPSAASRCSGRRPSRRDGRGLHHRLPARRRRARCVRSRRSPRSASGSCARCRSASTSSSRSRAS